jgi:hypothetical protein
MKAFYCFLFIFISIVPPLYAQENRTIGLFVLENAAEHGFPDSFHIYLNNHLVKHSSARNPLKIFSTTFDPALKDSAFRKSLLMAAAYGSIKNVNSNWNEVLFRLMDFRNNSLYEKTIPIQNNSLKEAALTAALQIRSTFDGSPLSRLRIDSEPSNLSIFVDGRAEGYAPKELILNPGLHQIELKGDRIKPYSEIVHIPSGATDNFFHQAEIKYYPTWFFLIIAVATTWESALMYHIERENRDKNSNRVESAKNARIILSSISTISWAGGGVCFWKNRKLTKKYLR